LCIFRNGRKNDVILCTFYTSKGKGFLNFASRVSHCVPWRHESHCNKHYVKRSKSRDSSVGIALGYGLNDRGSRVRFAVGAGNFSLYHRFQNCSCAHPDFYPVGTRSSFPGGWSGRGVKLTTYLHLVPRSKNVPSWRNAQLKKHHRDNFTFTFTYIFPYFPRFPLSSLSALFLLFISLISVL
jgi:hypothetical protein